MNAVEPDFGHLKKLWTLKMVVDNGNLKRASVRAKVSVSAVSQCITGLESTLARKLFLKKDRRLIPTQYCLQILQSVEPAFRVFDDLARIESPTICAPPIAWLDFGTSQCVASEILPSLVKQLKTKLPDLKLKLKVGRCGALISQVKKGDLCMALVAVDEKPKGVSAHPIYYDRLGLYVSSQAKLSADFQVLVANGVATLSAEAEGQPYYYTRFMRSFEEKLRPVLTCDTYETLYEIAAIGAMPVVLPERLAMRHASVLREITDGQNCAKIREAGKFKVQLISQATCDPSEDEFLISTLRSLI